MRVRIVVADQCEARFYDHVVQNGPLQLVGTLKHPAGRLHDRDLKSDRPGRVFDRAYSGRGRRGAVAHHATGSENSPHKQQALLFARRIARELRGQRGDRQFDALVLIAAPGFLGVLRSVLPKPLLRRVASQVPKDLVHEETEAVLRHLPEDLIWRASRSRFTMPRSTSAPMRRRLP
jgi:protein required for attachment to host cells